MIQRKKWNKKTGTVTCFAECKISYNDLVKYIGEEHCMEDDPRRTHSGTERFWVFEIYDDVALAFIYHDCIEKLNVGLNSEIDNPQDILKSFIPVDFKPSHGKLWD